jgi:hypothetical protein
MTRRAVPYLAGILGVLVLAGPVAAQTPDPARVIDLGQPDFTLSSLPTTMEMPAHTLAFRLTHRFTRPIDEGTAGDFFRDLFGFDSAARIGLELRYGLWRGTQVAIYRTNDRAIQLSAQQTVLRQTAESMVRRRRVRRRRRRRQFHRELRDERRGRRLARVRPEGGGVRASDLCVERGGGACPGRHAGLVSGDRSRHSVSDRRVEGVSRG